MNIEKRDKNQSVIFSWKQKKVDKKKRVVEVGDEVTLRTNGFNTVYKIVSIEGQDYKGKLATTDSKAQLPKELKDLLFKEENILVCHKPLSLR